ncbi:MAG: glycerate kinase [Maribacter sp.]
MKLLLIPDKFKCSLSSVEVSQAIIAGLDKAGIAHSYHYIKASDGGEGFMDAVAKYTACLSMQVISENPLGKPIQSYYLYNQKRNAAYIELANTSGMELLGVEERNPMLTSTYGTGLQIKDAIAKGIRNIYVGLGGSATNDGGIGIASALGYSFRDADGKLLRPTGENLIKIDSIDANGVIQSVGQTSFYAVNDVTNPLFGPQGASKIYAKQKGATAEMITVLDEGLRNLDATVSKQMNQHHAQVPGSGAAGGAAYGLKSFLGAQYLGGIDFIVELSGVHGLLKSEDFDYLITGEGKIDGQSLHGKLVQGILNLGKHYNLPVIAVCGQLDISKSELLDTGILDVLEIRNPEKSLDFNMKNAAALLTEKTSEYFRLLHKQNL